MTPKAMIYYGRRDLLPETIHLKAGPLTMSFDPLNAFLRHVRLGDHELVRTIYAAVRDQNWATIAGQVTNLKSEIGVDSFQLGFDVTCQEREVDYFWRGSITGNADGKVVYTFQGESRSHFKRNRIGLCVLHPIPGFAGEPCTIEHVDGSKEAGRFPETISPDQPFLDIRRIISPVAATGAHLHVGCEGETFEMQDQRNWGDASFKTYSTPQRLPKPQPVEPGQKVEQAVTISVVDLTRPVLPVVEGRVPQFSITTNSALALPPIGLCIPKAAHSPTVPQIERLKLLRLNHLRVDLDPAQNNFGGILEQAVAQSAAVGCTLQIALTLSSEPSEELRAIEQELRRTKPRVSLWLLFERGQG